MLINIKPLMINMKNITGIIILILGLQICNAQSLEEILDMHYSSMGFSQSEKVISIQIKGSYHNHFLKSISENLPEKLMKPDFVLSVEKGKSYLLQDFGMHGENALAFSNSMFWKDHTNVKPEKWNPNPLDYLKIQLDLIPLGFLYDYKELNYKLKKEDDININGDMHFQLQLITTQKDTIYYYLDKKKYYIRKMCFQEPYRPDMNQPSYTNSNFKKVDGIVFPFRQMYRAKMLDGSYGNKEVIITNIKLNPIFDKDHFSFETRIKESKKQLK